MPDERLAEVLPVPLEETLTERLGPERAVRTPSAAELAPSVPLLRGVVELAAATGTAAEAPGAEAPAVPGIHAARDAFEFLLGRHLDANPRQYTLTPPGPAALMAALAGPAATVLDPACGTGALLAAALSAPGDAAAGRPRPRALHGQDADPDLAALTALRLALSGEADVRVLAGDTLRADAFPALTADAVLCHPPFNERNWGHDELAYDPRWEYGFPARTESELAWVQHALARLRPGGTAVLLMPPAAASRRSGRRIRADLLRRGALRAVVALPAGAAPPYGIPLHLWVLRRPAPGERPPAELLLVDTAPDHTTGASAGRDRLDWPAVETAVLDAWRPFDRDGALAETPGESRGVPVVELLDDDVDLTPARHLPPPAAAEGAAQLSGVRERLTETLRRTRELTPPPAVGPTPGGLRWPATTVGELARAGALTLRAGGTGTAAPGAPVGVLTDTDVLAGQAPSGTLPEAPAEGPGRSRCSSPPETSSSPCSAAAPSPASSTRRPPAPPSAATCTCCAPTRLPWTPGSWPASCAPPPTTGRPARTPRPPPGSTSAASSCPACRSRNSSGTGSGSARWRSSRRRCGWRDGSASSWCRGCTTGSRTAP